MIGRLLLLCLPVLTVACAHPSDQTVSYASHTTQTQSAAAFPLAQTQTRDTAPTADGLTSCERSFDMIMAEATRKIDAQRGL